jgi:hypothetical protein
MMTTLERDFYQHIKSHPCIRCGSLGAEANHMDMFISPKTGLLLKRSHKHELAKYGCIPLCPECHRTAADSYHNAGHDAFIEALGKPPCWIYQYAATLILTFFLEREGAL